MSQLQPPTQIPSEPSGSAKEVTWFRQLLRCIRERTVKVGPGLRVSYKTDGALIEMKGVEGGGASGKEIQQYKIVSIQDDYITCQTWDGTTQGTDNVLLAKPYRLRKTPWDGVTVTYDFNGTTYSILYTYLATPGFRTAQVTTGGNQTTENQAIIPIYQVGDIVYGSNPEGGTETFVGSEITGLDINVDARAWACY